MQGWVKVHRRLKKWEWYKDSPVKDLFIELLLSAEYEDTKIRNIDVKRGQLLSGRKSLAFETGLSEQQVRTALKKLVSTNEITIESTSEYSIYTILSYESYQGRDEDSNQQSTSRITSQATITATTYKEDKKIRSKNNISKDILQKENLSFVAEEFMSVFFDWLEYKKERRETYKSEKSLKACYSRLLKLAENCPDIARKIIDNSMASNYSGFFALPKNNQSNNKNIKNLDPFSSEGGSL